MKTNRYCAAALLLSTALAPSALRAGKFFVYVGAYTGEKSKGIYSFQFDSSSGAMTSAALAAEVVNPSFLTIHPNRKFLYAVSELGNDGKANGAVTATLASGDEIVADYLVGCDGGRSTIRKSVNATFEGETGSQGMLVGDVRVTGLEPDAWYMWTDPTKGFVALCPFPHWEGWQFQAVRMTDFDENGLDHLNKQQSGEHAPPKPSDLVGDNHKARLAAAPALCAQRNVGKT